MISRLLNSFLAVFLLINISVLAQEKPAPFMVRITELTLSGYGCTVVTQDGRIRREVTPWRERREAFEGSASDGDMEQIKKAVTQPDFKAATNRSSGVETVVFNGKPALMVTSQDGRIVEVDVNLENERETVLFVDPNGRKSTPKYLVGLISFAKEVRKRRLPKLNGNVDLMCGNINF